MLGCSPEDLVQVEAGHLRLFSEVRDSNRTLRQLWGVVKVPKNGPDPLEGSDPPLFVVQELDAFRLLGSVATDSSSDSDFGEFFFRNNPPS